ncbi:MAG: MarR family transcriptional regulator [Candidatus Njordarchaeia archaeon]
MDDPLEKKKREFIKKLREGSIGGQQSSVAGGLLERLIDMEKRFKDEGLLTEDIKKVIASIRARLGAPEYIGVEGKAKLEKKIVELDIIDILAKRGDVIKVVDLRRALAKLGWVLSEYSIEKAVANLSKKGLVVVKKGYVARGKFSDSKTGKQILNYLIEKKKAKIDEIVKELGIERGLVHVILNELEENGMIVREKDVVFAVD